MAIHSLLTIPCLISLVYMGIRAESLGPNQYGCVSHQYVESGADVITQCYLPTAFKEVSWYDRAKGGSPPIISYETKNNAKNGEGYSSERFDITESGALIIFDVSQSDDGKYKVVCRDDNDMLHTYTTRITSYVRSTWRYPRINNCEEDLCYKHTNNDVLLQCRFEGSRPPTKIMWWRNEFDGYINIDDQTTDLIYDNETSTFSATSSVIAKIEEINPLSLWTCEAMWIDSEELTESKILVDFTSESLANLESTWEFPSWNHIHEAGNSVLLRCGSGIPEFNTWKKVTADGNLEFIGLQANRDIHMDSKHTNVEITERGDLKFSNVDLNSKGIYICSYSDREGLNAAKRVLGVIVSPHPPYPEIDDCNGNNICERPLDKSRSISLTCTLKQFHSNTTLAWKFGSSLPITVVETKESTIIENELKDLTITTTFKVTDIPFCDHDLHIKCAVEGYISPATWPYTDVTLQTAGLCKIRQDDEDDPPDPQDNDQSDGHIGAGVTVMLAFLIALVVVLIFVCLIVGLGRPGCRNPPHPGTQHSANQPPPANQVPLIDNTN